MAEAFGANFEDTRLGRLVESDAVTSALTRGKYRSISERALRRPPLTSSRPTWNGGHQSFHFSHGFTSKHPAAEIGSTHASERGLRRPNRVYLYPARGQGKVVRALGAHYDRVARRHWLSRAQVLAGGRAAMRAVAALRTRRQRLGWTARQVGRGRAPAKSAAELALYIGRADLSGEARVMDIVRDGAGEILFGNMTDPRDFQALRAFWNAVVERERSDGRTQCRIVLELPHELPPERLREIAQGVAAPFEERGLPYYLGVHHPDVEHGGDARNVHLHLIYHDRPAKRDGADDWEFAERKDREARGAPWVAGLRDRCAEVVNRVIGAENEARIAGGRPPISKRYDPRSYAEVGIPKLPTLHLGPRLSQFERAGVPTYLGEANLFAEFKYEGYRLTEAAHVEDCKREAVISRMARQTRQVLDTPGVTKAERDAAQAVRDSLSVALDLSEEACNAQTRRAIALEQAVETTTAIPSGLLRTDRDRVSSRIAWIDGKTDAIRRRHASSGDDRSSTANGARDLCSSRPSPAAVLKRLDDLRRETIAARRSPEPQAEPSPVTWRMVDDVLDQARKLVSQMHGHQVIGERQRLAKRFRSPTREDIDARFRSLAVRAAKAEIEARNELGGVNRSEKKNIEIERAHLKSLFPSTAALNTKAERARLRKELIVMDEVIKSRPALSELAAAQGIKLGEFKPTERPRSRSDRER